LTLFPGTKNWPAGYVATRVANLAALHTVSTSACTYFGRYWLKKAPEIISGAFFFLSVRGPAFSDGRWRG